MTTDITTIEQAMQHPERFRVVIFGSARTQPDDPIYKQVFALAKTLGEHDINIITGGGPGVMEAASKGVQAADGDSKSLGLTIELPWEADANDSLDIQQHFQKFSGRLDTFMTLANAVVVMPGGIGTCLELFYTWQLTQVQHICPIPIVLADRTWHTLYQWTQTDLLERGMISAGDSNNVFCSNNNAETLEILLAAHQQFQTDGGKTCLNLTKYKL